MQLSKDVILALIISSIIYLVAFVIHALCVRFKRNKFEKNQMNIISALCSTYENVYDIDINTGELFIYHLSGVIDSKYGKIFPSGTYDENIKLYTKNEVYEEDRILFGTISTINRVKSVLSDRSEYSFFYRVLRDDQIHYFQCLLLKPENSEESFIAAFKNADKIMSQQIETQNRIVDLVNAQSTQYSILNSMAEIYTTLHLLDLENDTLVEFNTTEMIRQYIHQNDNAAQQMRKVMSLVVYEDKLDEAYKFTDLKTIAKRLKDKKYISAEFNGPFSGWFRATFITVEKDEEGLPTKILFATQIIEEEKKREEKLIYSANNDVLTGLFNRHAYENEIKALKADPLPENFVFIAMDVNGLKNVNDNLGHEAGDELIKGAASCLSECLNQYGMVFRTGGDEFQALIYASPDKLEQLKAVLNTSIAAWKGRIVDEMAISFGFVLKEEFPELDVEEIAKIADKRMYEDKSAYYKRKGIDRRGLQDAFDALCKSYEKVLRVNLIDESFSIIRISEYEQDFVERYKKISDWFGDIGSLVHKDDRNYYTRLFNMKNLKRHFNKGNKTFGLRYRKMIHDEYRSVVTEIISDRDFSETNQIVYLYVKIVED